MSHIYSPGNATRHPTHRTAPHLRVPRRLDGRHRHGGRHHRVGHLPALRQQAAILVALFEQVIDNLLRDEERTIDQETDLGLALDLLIADQVEFVVGDRAIARVYHLEISNLPAADRSRLRRKQRLYLEEWVHVVRELRPELDDVSARTLVHAAIGAVQSPLFHNAGLPQDRLKPLLTTAARAVLLPQTPLPQTPLPRSATTA